MEFITDPARKIPVISKKDVVVSGGGPSGVMAAIAAARAGASTALIEANGFLGGAATMYLPYQGFVDSEGRQIIKGLAQELVDRLREKGGAYHKFLGSKLTNPLLLIDPEMVKLVSLEMVQEAGVELFLHAMLVDVQKEGRSLQYGVVQDKSGREAVNGKYFIDTTGDGDVAAKAGASFTVGREKDGIPQSATLTFRVDDVNEDVIRRYILDDPETFDLYEKSPEGVREDRKHQVVGFKNLVKKARAEGFPMPFDQLIYCSLLPEGAILINTTHVQNVRCQEAKDLTRAEIEARLQVPIIMDFLKRYVPGFERAQLSATSHEIGVRETRHIEGDYTLTIDDVRSGRRFEDTIAVGGYPIDIHSPEDKNVALEKVPAYGIPYRCLTVKDFDNLLVAGRCISSTHEALASARVMAICMAMGQAAGEAATLALQLDCSTRDVPVDVLQQRLREHGAFLF
jgi:hypothetical protein